MDYEKTGKLIQRMRKDQGMTQKQLADRMNLSDKTISKWERGCGLPEVSLLLELSDILQIDVEKLLNGNVTTNCLEGGDMKKAKYYVCGTCGSITVSTGNAEILCCSRKLKALIPQKATEEQRLSVEEIENDWFITSDHSMEKDNYITFVAFATGDKIQLIKQYPEWDFSLRIQKRGHGMLLWFAANEGLMYQLI